MLPSNSRIAAHARRRQKRDDRGLDDRGLVGTLFNGNSNKYMRKYLLPTDPGIAVLQLDSGGTEQARIA
jgi:hypothetical protein